MPGISTNLWRWLFLAGLFYSSSCQSVSSTFENKTGQTEGKPRVFSPRMDYDEWTPLGRGDPLKNNPTFDYVPPVLDRVQYWLDSHTTEPSAKRDILVLGVTAKKTSPKIPEQFLKFVDGPKFTRSNHQDVSYRNDFTGSTGAEPPKVVRTTNFRNGPIDYRNHNRIQSIPASYYPSPFYNQKTKPYTMMLPPPLAQKDKMVNFAEPTQQFNTQTEEGPVLQESQFYASIPPAKSYNQLYSGKSQSQTSSRFPPSRSSIQTASQVETIKTVYAPSSSQPTRSKYESITTPSVSLEKSNLIYQSTQTLSGGWPAGSNGTPLSTPTTLDAGQAIRQPYDYSRDQYETDHHVAASSNHQVVVEQNANIIVDGDSNENEEVVVGQKGVVSSSVNTASPVTTTMTTTMTTIDVSPSSSSINDEKENASKELVTDKSSEKMHIVVANAPGDLYIETHEAKKGPVTVVMPTNYLENKPNQPLRNTEIPDIPLKPTTIASIFENSTTIETEATSENSSKMEVQPIRSSTTGSSIFPEGSQHSVVSPNRMMPVHQQHAIHSSRHPVDSLVAFGPPQAPLSSLMHPQARPNNGMMHFLGSMRPSNGFRAPASMPMFPPMTHMHAPPPMRSAINHMGSSIIMDQTGSHRSPQLQDFSSTLVNSAAPSTLMTQSIDTDDRFLDQHRSRIPDTTTSIFTTPTASPFFPTVPSSIENSSLTVADSHTQDPEIVEDSSRETTSVNEKAEQDDRDGQRMSSTDSFSVHPSVSTSPQITTVPSLTTDPIFSHYKQPAKPIRGPMYLIIQGHSKVKTYKPTVSKHGVPVERNEIPESITERQLSKFEQFVQENTRNDGSRANAAVIEKKKAEEKARAEKLARSRQNDLMSLVESGLASFTVSPSSFTTENDRRANSMTTIEIGSN